MVDGGRTRGQERCANKGVTVRMNNDCTFQGKLQ